MVKPMKALMWLILAMITGSAAGEIDGTLGWLLLIVCAVSAISAVVCMIRSKKS